MFITEKMQRVNVLLPREDATRFWDKIGRLGILQPGETQHMSHLKDMLTFVDLGDLLGRIREAAGFLKVNLEAPLDDPAITPLSPAELATRLKDVTAELDKARGQLQKLREAQRELDRAIDRLTVQKAHLKLLDPLEVNIGALLHLARFHVFVGTLPQNNFDQLDRSLDRFPHVLSPYRADQHRIQLLAVCLNQDKSTVEEVLKSALFRPLELPEELRGSAREALEYLRKEEERLQDRRTDVGQQLSQFEGWRAEKQAELSDFLKVNSAVLSVHAMVGQTNAVTLATGWMPARDFGRLYETVQEEPRWVVDSEEIPYENEKDEDGVSVPSKLRNPRFLRAFEGLVSLYGTPRYGGFDPTVIFSVSYIIMFGMMFGDLGHGFILLLSGLFLWLWPRLRPGFRQTGTILLTAGTSSMVFGTLYGSVFGYENIIQAVWFRPFSDINRILIYALAVGATVIIIGILANVVSLLIQRRYIESFFARFGVVGLWFYLGMLLTMYLFMQGNGMNLGMIIVLMFLPLIVMVLKEPIAKLFHRGQDKANDKEEGESPFIRLIVIGVDLFETMIVYFSNSVSFIRVAAFALNHIALSLAFFQLGAMLRGLPGGSVLYVLTIAGGNLLILVLEGGVVGIQVLRLEFYEFFSKFFEAEGTAFQPFKLEFRRRR